MIEYALGDLADVRVVIYEPTSQYQNVTRRTGVEKLTPPRALIAKLVRRYWMLGMELLSTVDWLVEREGREPTVDGIKKGLANWPAGKQAAARKVGFFSDAMLQNAITRLQQF